MDGLYPIWLTGWLAHVERAFSDMKEAAEAVTVTALPLL